jgi:hypothetical protein
MTGTGRHLHVIALVHVIYLVALSVEEVFSPDVAVVGIFSR